MKKCSFILLMFVINISVAYTQGKPKKFNFGLPTEKTSNSLYNQLEFLDSRPDTTDFGFVQTGMLNHKVRLISEDKLSILLQKVLDNMIDSTAQSGTMLFELRQLRFSEITGMTSEKGYCSLIADLYQKEGESYKKLAFMDTMVVVKAMDVTGGLLKAAGRTVCEFIRDNLQKKSDDTDLFTFEQVVKMDSIEKQKIKLYTTEKYNDGLYYNYTSFKEQMPDKEVSVILKKEKIASVKLKGENDKLIKVKPKEVYALVFQGIPYIATEYGFYPLVKSNDDFYFTGKAKKNVSSTDIFVTSFAFGVLGAALMSAGNSSAFYEMKIDYRSGRYIILKEVIEQGNE